MRARAPDPAAGGAPTPVNLAQHSYFNLAGHPPAGAGAAMSVLGHEVQLSADTYTPVNHVSIPTGDLVAVDAGAGEFDFRRPAVLGDRVAAAARRAGRPAARYDPAARALADDALDAAAAAATTVGAGFGPPGFDHNFVVTGGCAAPHADTAAAAAAAAAPGSGVRHVATVRDPGSGRTLTVESDAPGVQFYTGNYLGPTPGKGGAVYPRHAGLCLETQHFPDSAAGRAAAPGRAAAFAAGAAPVLRPGGEYAHTVVYRFAARPA
jgi:aldose 1-epimerase